MYLITTVGGTSIVLLTVIRIVGFVRIPRSTFDAGCPVVIRHGEVVVSVGNNYF